MKRIAALLSCIVAFGFVSLAFAQSGIVAPPGVEEQISIRINPEMPQPGDNVDISVQSYSFNVNKAYIVWSIDGVVKSEGPGIASFSFTAGRAGTVQKVNVSLTTEDQRSISKTLTFAPAKVGLVVEADTYTPPFYKGKALFTPQSTLKVVAFPELITESGYQIPAENLVYNWKVDGKVMQSASGYGKQSFIVEGNLIPRPFSVTAEVSAYNSSLKAEQSIRVEPSEPEIVLYEDSLLYGIRREQAFTSRLYLNAREVKLVAEPYYMTANVPHSTDLRYVWTLNDQVVPPLTKPNTIGLENRTGEAGVATLGLSIENLTKLLQAPTLSTRLQFEKQ